MTRRRFNIIARKHADQLYRFVLFHLQEPESSQDIVQEAFLRLWEHRKEVQEERAVKWLFTTSRNLVLNHLRHQKVVREHAVEVNYCSYVENKGLENNDLICQCLEGLPEIQQTVMLLRDLEGYDYKSIGEITGLKESQVKVYLFRARKKFKLAYQQLENEYQG
ncbi:MAG: RNA polymerase sigma factor [Bacteroidota bacterium]